MINEYPQNDNKQRGEEGKTKTADFIRHKQGVTSLSARLRKSK